MEPLLELAQSPGGMSRWLTALCVCMTAVSIRHRRTSGRADEVSGKRWAPIASSGIRQQSPGMHNPVLGRNWTQSRICCRVLSYASTRLMKPESTSNCDAESSRRTGTWNPPTWWLFGEGSASTRISVYFCESPRVRSTCNRWFWFMALVL
jgi:hypothetical protein